MKKLILFLFLASCLQSCVTIGTIGIKGKYQEGPVKREFNHSYDETWNKVIDFISDIGLNVKMVDKGSGLVISDPTSFTGKTSVEDKAGKILNSEAFIVTSRTNDPNVANPIRSATASYNLRVKETGPGKSVVSVLLYNITVTGIVDTYTHKGKSTGNFEKWILDNLYK
jgi:hypothetical protein